MSQSDLDNEDSELEVLEPLLDDSELRMPSVNSDETDNSEEHLETTTSSPGLEVIAKLEADLQEAQSKYLYAMAEMDNIKKRHFKERSELIKYQGESISRDLLEILDDLERVSAVAPETNSQTILEGVQLIGSRMKSIFERYSIKPEDCTGSKFDPAKHEALTMVNSDEVDSGNIIQVIKKCYYYKDKLLRVAQVVVSNGPKAVEEGEPN